MDDRVRPTPWEQVAQLARLQEGHVAMWQARTLGLSRKRLNRRVRDEGWQTDHRAVVRLPGAIDGRRSALWAALLAVADLTAPGRAVSESRGGSSVPGLVAAVSDLVAVTAWSAAEEYGFHRFPAPCPQLLVRHATVCRREGIRVVRSRRGVAGFWQWREGLPVALPFRMLWDAAHLGRGRRGSVTALADLAVMLDRTRVFSVDELLAVVDEPVAFGLPRRQPPVLRATAERLRPGFSHSQVEGRARTIAQEVCAELGVTLVPRPHLVSDEAGVKIAEVDLAIPSLKFGGEVDGPHHDEPSVQAYDRRRDGRLTRRGWVVVRYRVADIEADPEAFRRGFRRDVLQVMALREQQAA